MLRRKIEQGMGWGGGGGDVPVRVWGRKGTV